MKLVNKIYAETKTEGKFYFVVELLEVTHPTTLEEIYITTLIVENKFTDVRLHYEREVLLSNEVHFNHQAIRVAIQKFDNLMKSWMTLPANWA